MSYTSYGKPNSMIYLPPQDKSKYSSKREMPVLGERLSKLLIFLCRFTSGNVASTVWLDLPILIRQRGRHSVPPWSDSLKRYHQWYMQAPGSLSSPPTLSPMATWKQDFQAHRKANREAELKKTKGRKWGKRRIWDSLSNNHEQMSLKNVK